MKLDSGAALLQGADKLYRDKLRIPTAWISLDVLSASWLRSYTMRKGSKLLLPFRGKFVRGCLIHHASGEGQSI